MPDLLCATPFDPRLLHLVKDFDCGDLSYHQELSYWIYNESIQAIQRGTKVWLYINESDDVVGYGSLGTTRWRYPNSDSHRLELAIIPAVAIRRVYWGKPDGAEDKNARYSSQIMDHLLHEAGLLNLPAVGLFIHPDNQTAIKLYERFKFRPFHHSYTDPITGITYSGYVRPIAR